jgi:hypothetical protein
MAYGLLFLLHYSYIFPDLIIDGGGAFAYRLLSLLVS